MSRRKRRLASRLRDYVRGLLAFLFSNVGVIVLVVGYTIAGAFMFQAIEGASEIERASNMTRERDNIAEYLWHNVTLRFNPMNETALKASVSIELQRYQRKIVVAVRRGWDGGRSSRQWSFSSAFLYSLTVITTIGYGHLSPRTSWGKITTIFYALLGMPLFLLYLANVGELLARWFKCIYALICLCRGCPGFTRRRVAKLRSQLEISDAESIERPEDWRTRNQVDVAPGIQPNYRHQANIFPTVSRIPSDNRFAPNDRISPDYRSLPVNRYPSDHRVSLNNRFSSNRRLPTDNRFPLRQTDRYQPDPRFPLDTRFSQYNRQIPDRRFPSNPRPIPDNRFTRDSRLSPDHRFADYRIPSDHRLTQNNRFPSHHILPPDFRIPPYHRDPSDHPYHRDRHYRNPPNPQSAYRIPADYRQDYRFPPEIYPPDFRYPPDPQKHFQRRPDYFRSASMPQPWESSRYRPDLTNRGWSEPLAYRNDSQGSSEFSYVTFDAQTITVPLSVCVAILVGYLIFGSMLFGMWENWNQLDGAYFCFISLSSIGFGDFVPGERIYTPRIETSFIACSMYLMLGMALVAMCFNLMQEQVIHYVAGLKRAVKRMCRCKR